MKRNPSPAAAINVDGAIARADASPRNRAATPEKPAATTPPGSSGSRLGAPPSSCKRRRLASEDDENIGQLTPVGLSARRLSYRASGSDSSDGSGDEGEDPVDQEVVRMRQESILRKIRRLNCEDGEDQLLHASASAKLFEYVKGYDVVASVRSPPGSEVDPADGKAAEGAWKYRGSGHVKFIKCLEEGWNFGMVRMELTKNCTIETLMCHELIHEDVEPMPSKKGKAYTWRVKDWAYRTAVRTFAIRFDDDMDALEWKAQLEQSKANNYRVRKGLDRDRLSLDDVCASFKCLSTSHSGASGTSGEE